MVTVKYYNKLMPQETCALKLENLLSLANGLIKCSTTFHCGSSGYINTTPIFLCTSASAVFGRLCSASVALSSYFWSLWSLEDDEEAMFEETSPVISCSEVGIE